jgi:AcrR family transcriptional regulator
MTITARKQREKLEMRRIILDAAKGIFLEKGFYSASIRNIAEKIEYSPGTIYLYYKDKDDIFHALHEEGFGKMLGMMQPLQHVSDPMERLIAMGKVYMEFALQNKELYDLMFIMEAPINAEHNREKWEMGGRTLDLLKKVLAECQEKGYFKGLNIEYLSFMIWSSLHGMCALFCRRRCQVYEHKEETELLQNGMAYFTDLLTKKR